MTEEVDAKVQLQEYEEGHPPLADALLRLSYSFTVPGSMAKRSSSFSLLSHPT